MRRGALIGLALLAAVAGGQPLAARSPRLTVEAAPPVDVPAGASQAGEGAFLYRPPGREDGPRPLLVLFHGAGGSARRMLERMIPEAERCGCLLLALQSQAATWDLVTATGAARRRERPARLDSLFGDDAGRVERALSPLLASPIVDRQRIVLLGFSDGASYALSLALANPELVRGAVAIAPGFHLEPGTIAPSQRLFIAHSPDDRILSFAHSRDGIAGSLRRAGFAPVFHAFRGGHVVDPAVVALGVDHVLGSGRAAR